MTDKKKDGPGREATQFKPGQSGNPLGRPKGARSKLGEAFLQDLLADWEENGVEALKQVREEKPHEYVKVVARTLPQELNVKVNELDDLTDDQLRLQYARIARRLAEAGIDHRERAGPAEPPEPTGGVQTLQ